ncbi:MAG: hypothetical protein ACREI8_00220, partial [Myxococcota bacterium]
MTLLPPPTPRAFRVRHVFANALPGVLAGSLVAVYLAALLQLDEEAKRALLWGALAALVSMTPLGHWLERRAQRDVVRALAKEARGALDGETLRAGYRAALRLPLFGVAWHVLCWVGSGLLVVIWLAVWLREFDRFRSIAILCAALTGAAIVLPFAYYALRRVSWPLRARWGARLSHEEQQRETLVVPLRWKLVAPTAAACVAIAVFVALFAHATSLRPVEAHDLRGKSAFLHWGAERLAAGEASLDELRESARAFQLADDLL